jgi:hypothetical protein
MSRRRAKPTNPADAVAARKAAEARRAERRVRDAASAYLADISKRRMAYVAILLDYARAAAEAAEPGYDGAPPEIVDAPEPGENPQLRVSRNLREHPLDLMAHKRQITPEQFGAGEMFRRDLELAEISPMSGRAFESIYTTELSQAKAVKESGLDEMMGPKTFAARRAKQPLAWKDLRPAQLDAMDRANKARRYVDARAGKAAGEIVTHFCRGRLTVQEIGATRKYGARHTVGRRLQAALDALAEHYGTKRRAGRAAIRSWGDGSHVPSLDGASVVPEARETNELEAAE